MGISDGKFHGIPAKRLRALSAVYVKETVFPGEYLKGAGYSCISMHPYYASGWSRSKVYPLLGFDDSLFIDDFDQTNIMREYITDQELYNKIIDQYEAKTSDEKLFILGVTMQNHGGYTDYYDNFQNTINLKNHYYSDVNQYLSLIHESDKALENLITYFENVDDKVEIVFFGDHQPSLNNNFYQSMNGKGLSVLPWMNCRNYLQYHFCMDEL